MHDWVPYKDLELSVLTEKWLFYVRYYTDRQIFLLLVFLIFDIDFIVKTVNLSLLMNIV